MTLDDVTLYGRDDEMDEYSDTGGYGESLEEDYWARDMFGEMNWRALIEEITSPWIGPDEPLKIP